MKKTLDLASRTFLWPVLGKDVHDYVKTCLQITRLLSFAYHPQTNGQTERVNQILEQFLRCYITHLQDDWFSLLPIAEFVYNNQLQISINMSPFKANYGYDPCFLLNRSTPCYTSPPPPSTGIFSTSQQPPPPAISVLGTDEFEVEEILDSRIRYGRLEYLIHWKVYGPEEMTWEPETNIHAPIKIRAFHRAHPGRPASDCAQRSRMKEETSFSGIEIQIQCKEMRGDNHSVVTEFFILGLPSFNAFKVPFFIVLLLVYSLTISENFMIILLVTTCHRLRSPMDFFLGHLSLCDIIFITNIVPNLLHVIIREGATIPFSGCFTQFFFHGVSVCAECFLLTVMSYDRYLAICDPLHYISIMDLTFRYSSVTCSWMLSFILSLDTMMLTYNLDFCGPNSIDHFFCDLSPLLELSCSDTTALEINTLLISFPIILLPFIFITVTYVCISLTIIKIPSITGRQKAFSTCSSHLAVVCTYYGSMFTIYMIPSQGHSLTINRFLSLVYIVFTPFLNPVIYSLRNQEIIASLVKYKW
ncbi:olfactory receptor 1468-like [Pelodytes ibericus]